MKTYTVVYLSFGKGFKVMLFIFKFFFGFQLFSLLTNQLLGKLITTLCVMWGGGGGVMNYFLLKNTAIHMFCSYRVLGESKQLGNASIISNIGISAIVKQQLNYTIWYNSEYIFKGNALKRTYRLVRFGVRFLKRQYRKRRV